MQKLSCKLTRESEHRKEERKYCCQKPIPKCAVHGTEKEVFHRDKAGKERDMNLAHDAEKPYMEDCFSHSQHSLVACGYAIPNNWL